MSLADSNGAVGRVVEEQAPEATGVPNQPVTPYQHTEVVNSPAAIDEDTTDPVQTSDKSGIEVSAGTNQTTHSDMRPADIEKLGEFDANSTDKVRLDAVSDAQPPPDWYPDPSSAGQLRYWDGSQWTDQGAPAQSTNPPPKPTSTGSISTPTKSILIAALALVLLITIAIAANINQESPCEKAGRLAREAAANTSSPAYSPEKAAELLNDYLSAAQQCRESGGEIQP